jgi:hypothetical protein
MIVLASTRAARAFRVARFGALALVSMWLAHDAVFAVEHGIGAGFAAAMSAGGHDGYWWAFSLVVATAATLLGLWVAIRLIRLAARTQAVRPRPARRPVPTYRGELGGLWIALFAVTTAAFAFQENVEHLAGHGHLIGLGALTGPEYPLAVPVIAAVTFVAAALGALVRWRIAVLEARIGGRLHEPRARGLHRSRPPAAWAEIASARAHAWFLVRLDAGRAPPRSA